MRTRVAAVLLLLLAAGCDSGSIPGVDSGPDPQPVADALASGLGKDDLSGVAFGDPAAAQKSYDEVVAGLGEITPTVSVDDVQESGRTATATLAWSWPVADQPWTYTTTAALSRAGDAWEVAWSPDLVAPGLEDGSVLDTTTLTPRRGEITGAHGSTIVTERPVVRFGIDKTQVPQARAKQSALALAHLLHIDAAAYAKRVVAAGESAYVEGIVYRRDDAPQSVLAGLHRITGARALGDHLALAPTSDFAAPILGRVGEATAEMIKDDPERYHLGDVVGVSGLELRYDGRLRGSPGVVVEAVTGDRRRQLYRQPPVAGKPLALTMDPRLQSLGERLLAHVGPASAIVAIRPSTGDILAAANGPGTNGYNDATYGQFAPGSTFKSVTSLALLRSGLTPSSVVPCTTSVVVDGKRFENYDDYPPSGLGQIPLRTALANSCNTAFISQHGRLSRSALVDAAGSLGMGVDHDLGFPAYFGNVEPPASETEGAADMIGQGTILASPMVMATVIASIESGRTVVPRLVTSVDGGTADVTSLRSSEAAALRSMLRGVVTSGSGSILADVPGAPLIAKTGTAEYDAHGKRLLHAWMIAARPDLAVAVFVDTGTSGSGTAGPILEAFLRQAG